MHCYVFIVLNSRTTPGTLISSAINFDDYKTPGVWSIEQTIIATQCTNIPANTAGTIVNMCSGDLIIQLYITYNANIYKRNYQTYNTTWSSWLNFNSGRGIKSVKDYTISFGNMNAATSSTKTTTIASAASVGAYDIYAIPVNQTWCVTQSHSISETTLSATVINQSNATHNCSAKYRLFYVN